MSHHVKLTVFLVNYVDNFMGVESFQNNWPTYEALGNLLCDIGAKEAANKAVPPTHMLEFLGVWFNLLNRTIHVTQDRMVEIKAELDKWTTRTWFTRKQLEKLLGKLQFVANCVRPGRVMLLRLRNALRENIEGQKSKISEEMKKDLQWWSDFLPEYNGVSLMWMEQRTKADSLVASDASLVVMGAQSGKKCLVGRFPDWMQQMGYKIHHFELVVVVMALKTWKEDVMGCRFAMLCDNQAVVEVVNGGNVRDVILQQWLRELTYIAVTAQFEVVLKYGRSVDNRVPDILSRLTIARKFRQKWQEIKQEDWELQEIEEQQFDLSNNW